MDLLSVMMTGMMLWSSCYFRLCDCQLCCLSVEVILPSPSQAVAYLGLKYNTRMGFYSGQKVRWYDGMTVDLFCPNFQLGKQPKAITKYLFVLLSEETFPVSDGLCYFIILSD